MNAAQKAEALGHEAAIELLNRLLNCKSQAQASPVIREFLVALCNEPKKHRTATCGGAAVGLVDVLMLGVAAIPKRGR